MNKKMLLGLVVVTIFFLLPYNVTADQQGSLSQTAPTDSATTHAAAQATGQTAGETVNEPVPAVNPEKSSSTPDMAEAAAAVEQLKNKNDIGSVEDAKPTTPQPETALAEAEQSVTIEAENVSEDQAGAVTSLDDVKKTPSDFQIEIWTDRDDGLYHIGNDLVIYLKANKDSRVTLFDVGTSGKVHIIFPNEFQQDNLIKAGQTYMVPAKDAKWTFKIQGPAGKNILKAIATVEDVQLLAQADVKKAGIFQEVKKTEGQLAKDISIALKPVDTMQWTETGTELTVLK